MTQLPLMPTLSTLYRKPQEPIVREAEIDGKFRWSLKRAWGAGPMALFCGLNPSTADGKKDDPTIRRCMDFACRLGYGSMVMVNVFPYITPDPKALATWLRDEDVFDRFCPEAMLGWRMDNAETVSDGLRESELHIAMWGSTAHFAELKWLLDQLCDYQGGADEKVIELADWKCLGTNADGSPRHILARGRNRVPDDFVPIPWKGKV